MTRCIQLMGIQHHKRLLLEESGGANQQWLQTQLPTLSATAAGSKLGVSENRDTPQIIHFTRIVIF